MDPPLTNQQPTLTFNLYVYRDWVFHLYSHSVASFPAIAIFFLSPQTS